MPIGIQELFALMIVVAIVAFALYRRRRRQKDAATGCADCAAGPGQKTGDAPGEQEIHRFRRRK